ncbi:MAG: tRNA (guanine-N7-)-methyltransferase [Candidatus Marinamargulisbacteria bacterium]|jgi:tRNA (guanine-N7-)-methyltransferase
MGRIRTHTNPFNYHKKLEPIDFAEMIPVYTGKLQVEIGFGRGVFIRSYAKDHPETAIVGMDIRKSVAELLQVRLKKEKIENVGAIHTSGQRCIEDLFEDDQIERIFVFHPDPWLKKRHHNRRVLSPEFLKDLRPKLTIGARLYLTTDVRELWDDLSENILASGFFKEVEEPEFWDAYYQSHWDTFSKKDGRTISKGVFELIDV